MSLKLFDRPPILPFDIRSDADGCPFAGLGAILIYSPFLVNTIHGTFIQDQFDMFNKTMK